MKATSTKEHNEFTLKEKLTYSLLGLVVLGGSFIVGRKFVREARSISEQKKTYQEGNAPAYAQQLKMAFENDNNFGWGTNEEAVRKAVRAIPSKDEFKKVIVSYQRLYARSLMADLKSELETSEYNEMLAIIGSKPDKIISGYSLQIGQQQYLAWAKRLKAAFDLSYGWFPATDEEAIKAVFIEVPTQSAFEQVAKIYQAEYGNNLISDLKNELELWEYGPMMDIIYKKPKA